LLPANSDLSDVVARLKARRDDLAHDRGPSATALDTALAEAESGLDRLYDSADFLSRFPLRDISSARRVGRQQRGTYSCRDLVGDHPVPASRQIEFAGETPATGLHLIDQSGKPHFIEPWLVRRRCSKCQHQETYVLDRYMRDGTIMLKSLEYGHESEANDLRAGLGQVGIHLPPVS
jgi:hypothetical protein